MFLRALVSLELKRTYVQTDLSVEWIKVYSKSTAYYLVFFESVCALPFQDILLFAVNGMFFKAGGGRKILNIFCNEFELIRQQLHPVAR